MIFSIYTAYPRGYCAWVHRAVDMLARVVSEFAPPIYVNHEIIHNRYVVAMFERKWVVFEPDIEQIPVGSLVVLSAHGSGPSYIAHLRNRQMRWIDATCPLVEKVHREAKDCIEKGYHILYIGKKWHQEALWVIDEGEAHFTLITSEGDIDVLDFWKDTALAVLTQTTLSVDDTAILIEKIREKYPNVLLPRTGDICYATTNRQIAVKRLAEICDMILVVGSKNSSNSNKLREVAQAEWKRAYLIDDANEISTSWLEWAQSVWVTAWASWPEELVEWVVTRLQELWGQFREELRLVEEHMKFPSTIIVHK